MISTYPLNLPDLSIVQVNFAFRLVAGIIERARADLNGLDPTHRTCDATFVGHNSDYCAREFITKLDEFLSEHPEADHIEVALEVLRWQR